MPSTVLIVSQRNRPDGFGRQPGYVSFTEAEDVLGAVADADFAYVESSQSDSSVRLQRAVGRTMRRFGPMGPHAPLPAPKSRRSDGQLRQHYDVVVFVGFTLWDMPLLERLQGVRARADHIIAWFPEAWASDFDNGRLTHEPFDLADTIFVGMKAAAEHLQTVADRPVYYVPPAVDALRFAGTNLGETRQIDVLGIGRRDSRLHEALLDWARKSHRLYVYDTITGSQAIDATAHRENLAETYRRSKTAITNYAKYNQPSVVGTERETPGRLWEGLASGVSMIGFPPDESLQKALIGELVVESLADDPSIAVEQIEQLTRTDRTQTRRHNVQLALRGHDWIHRWATLFAKSGIDAPPRFETRIEQLETLASSMERSPSVLPPSQ